MATRPDNTPLVVIVGETASGKTALAIQLAQRFGGEIVAADSRTVYQGLTIAAAKPTLAERAAVPHHLLDVVTPDQPFSVADFKQLAAAAIHEIGRRHGIAYLVGGSGLYIDAVLYDFQFRPKGDTQQRAYLDSLSVEQLQNILIKRGIPLPENTQNPRHLVRAVETNGAMGRRDRLRPNTLVLGLQVDKDVLRQRIAERVEAMVENGLLSEVQGLATKYGWNASALQTPAYKAFRAYFAGEISLAEAKQLFVQHDMHLAKRQRAWFKRSNDIHWICNADEAVDFVTTFLNK